ncbi:probable 3-beta-hydroxysteroid-Delta(8),Delta(7)-isomerase [Rhodamnia argentea]|uniref:Probable 3-beta-hydroxysteroid-Delta(8),Delta(7)-isomerase n=1 Tax=Rhodamnia argentea TaxID=178133 RepID=A0ABM3HSA2_9MYRT|nr:probable 3-beta-hydroxysteroid-Delta(8),Delta(7)-isomerase [Rhodamnia argentea]XP_048139477.1 probable 3-beta-hydroxysteroid-Delta(8),Delta(7)-isomerase [Rhodamnia argentea]
MEATRSPHPYVPRDLKLPGYVPNLLSQLSILGIYGIASVLVAAFIWFISGMPFPLLDKVLMCWWAFTGLTHMILESYYLFSPEFYKDESAFYLSEVWKEYSKGDSRYAGRDSVIVTLEILAVVLVGPASLLAVYAIAKGKLYSYILQFAVSLIHLCGTAVYFITALLEGDDFAASPFYYYFYFVVINSFWIVIPTAICIRCWKKICAAFNNQGQKKVKSR